MKVQTICESGRFEALIGLGLSYGITSNYSFFQGKDTEIFEQKTFDKLEDISFKLASKDHGHNKFLESICIWLDISAPRYWWQEFDTYRIGVTKQSESTMHTITHRHLEQDDFQYTIDPVTLGKLNYYIDIKDFVSLKNELPEGFLQRRIVCTNYKVLRHIFRQRRKHKLREWKYFIKEVFEKCYCPEYLKDIMEDYEPDTAINKGPL
jgi:hypothetical protein